MDSLQLLYLIEAIVLLLFGAVYCAITCYVAIHERTRFQVVGVMFTFLFAGSILLSANCFLVAFTNNPTSLALTLIGDIGVGAVISANVQVLFFWINFVSRFFSKIQRQKLVDAAQIVLLLVVNVGHIAFGILQHTSPSTSLLQGYRMIMIGFIGVLEIVLIVVGTVLWYKLHLETDKGFYVFARKIARVLITVGGVGLLWVCRYSFAMHTNESSDRVFADSLVAFFIAVLLFIVYLHCFARRYLKALFCNSISREVPPLSPPLSSSPTASPSSAPSSPRKPLNIGRAAAMDSLDLDGSRYSVELDVHSVEGEGETPGEDTLVGPVSA